jgi:hypothetical protein
LLFTQIVPSSFHTLIFNMLSCICFESVFLLMNSNFENKLCCCCCCCCCTNAGSTSFIALHPPVNVLQLLSLITSGVHEFDERGISNILHGLAVLELDQERELLSSLLSAAEAIQFSRFSPQGLANTAWALAALHVHPGERLSQKLLAASAGMMTSFKPIELAQLGWAVAALHIRVPEQWFRVWRGSVGQVLQGLTPQGMSMVVWAAARMSDHQLPPASPSTYLQQQQQHTAAAATAAASGGHSGSSSSNDGPGDLLRWLQAVEKAIGRQVWDFSPHSLSICLWGIARLGYR